jgi:OPA family glycerol-3-phosphate transporter-like MFS transporter/OPA family sugar phosphate sensor protein UhpC-like MFS transporter
MPALVDRLLKPPPDAPLLDATPAEVQRTYRYWRTRQLYSTFIGYAVFYIVRKNIPIALPALETELHLHKRDLGAMLTLHDLVYGASKFANGVLGDRSNPRYFMACGLALSAAMNVAFGASSALATLMTFWTLNGWFQGMGFPPCARVLSHWFRPEERGTMWGLWNTSHQVGAAAVFVLSGYLMRHAGWRACFFVPALVALACSMFLVERLRDTPGSLGLPPIERFGESATATTPAHDDVPDASALRRIARARVFGNPIVWVVCVANFFVYAVRYGFVNWAPTYLHQVRHVPLDRAGGMVAGFEVAGLAGSLLAGWITDRFFASRRGPVCVLYALALAAFVFAFWRAPAGHTWLDALLLALIGAAVYGPQFLVGVMVADIATKHAASTAIGLTGLFGYASGVVSGWGLGLVLDRFGWNGGFYVLLACSLMAALPFAFTWSVQPTRVETARA